MAKVSDFAGAGDTDEVAAGTGPTGGGAGTGPTGGGGELVVLDPGCSVMDLKRSFFLASDLLLWITFSVVTVVERSSTQ